MKTIATVVIFLCFAYFTLGYIAVYFGFINQEQYLAYAGYVGSLASVAGLFAFVKPSITKDDLKNLELETLKSLAETTEQLKALEQKRAQAQSEMIDVEVKQKEMELLVQKAATLLFLKEFYVHCQQKILEHIKSNDTLAENLSQLTDLKGKINVLEGEVATDPNVKILRETIELVNTKHQDFLNTEPLPLLELNFFGVTFSLVDTGIGFYIRIRR